MTLARNLILVAASATLVGGVWVTPEPPPWWRLALAVGVAAAVHLLRQQVRVGATVFFLAWGEAAVIIGLYLVPPGWVPLALALGVLLASAGRAVHHLQPPSRTLPEVVGLLTLAAGAGALLCRLVAAPYQAALSPPVVAGLLLGAAGYFLTATVLSHLMVLLRHPADPVALLRRTLGYKLPMLAGGVVLGLGAVAVAHLEWRWLLVLPLVLALLHWAYAYRVRGRERRRMWSMLAAATRSLNRPDEPSVAAAGARGALEVFAVGRVEVELRRPGNPPQAWLADLTGIRPRGSQPDPQRRVGTVAPLIAGEEQVGELRVYFPEVAGPGNGEYAALRAYADALAAALQDAATHEQLHRLLERSVHQAQHDRLTGVLGRGALLAHGETALQLGPHGSPVVLLVVDVDHFREINDTLGHSAGDRVLEVIADRLRAHARPGELLGRLGGDEFALLVTAGEVGSLTEAGRGAVARGRELVRTLAEEAMINGVAVSIETSVAAVAAPSGTADMAELLRRADAAMAVAKQGGGTVAWYDPRQDAGATDRPALLAELHAALERDDELVLAWQPVVDLATGAPIGAEALVRWRHPQRGLLPPAEFLRVVEHSDLLGMFTEYVIDKALAAAAAWAHRGPAVPVAVNLSARSLVDPQLPRIVSSLLRRYQVPGRQLILEVTETVVSSELPSIPAALERLRLLGVRLSVDDFGTGYASLTLLTRVPLDEVKLDGGFVSRAGESAEADAIVRTAVELGREMGMRVVAEGVETAQQREQLRRLGCQAGQGFHLATPTSGEKIEETLRELATRSVAAQQGAPLTARG